METASVQKQAVARNVINEASLRASLSRRAEEDNLSPPVKAWLTKQFKNWVINYFAHMKKVPNPKAYKMLTGENAPDWFVSKYKNRGESFWYVDPEHEQLRIILAKLIEWLEPRASTKLAQKFPRMTPSQILKKWEDDHRRFLKTQKTGLLRTSGKALQEVLKTDEMTVYEFAPEHAEFRAELFNESIMMQHCIGQFVSRTELCGGYGEYYAKAAEEKRLRLFTLRSDDGRSHVTLSAERGKKGKWRVEQIKGKQNRPPVARYVPATKAVLNHLEFSHIEEDYDCMTMGLYYIDGKTVTLNEIDDPHKILEALVRNPTLIEMLEEPMEAHRWIALLQKPSVVNQLESPGLALQLMAYLLDPLAQNQSEKDDRLSLLASGEGALSIDGEKIALPPLYLGENV